MKTAIKQLITEYTNQFIGSDIVKDVDSENSVAQDTVKDYLRIMSKEEILDLMKKYVVPVPDREISTYTKQNMGKDEVFYKFTGTQSFLKFVKEVNGDYVVNEWQDEYGKHCVTCTFNKYVTVGYNDKRLVRELSCEPKRNRLFIRFFPGNKGGALNDYVNV